MKFPFLKDSRDNPSATLTMTIPALLVVLVKYLMADIGPFPEMTGGEFALAIGAVGGIYQLREYIDKQ